MIVGDPLQLEPVVTLPQGGQRALLREFGVGEQWALCRQRPANPPPEQLPGHDQIKAVYTEFLA